MGSKLFAFAVVVLAVVTWGCGEETSLRTSDLNGAYRIVYHTQNAASCDAEGAQIPEDARRFGLAVRIDNTPEDNRMMMAPCDTEAQCQSYMDSISKLWTQPGGFSLPAGSDAQGWTGQGLVLQVQETPAQCFVDHIDRTLTAAGQGRIRLEERHHRRPVQAGDELCNSSDLKDVGPCTSLNVIEAELIP